MPASCDPLGRPKSHATATPRRYSARIGAASMVWFTTSVDGVMIAEMMKVKDSYNLDALSQRLALAALNDLDAFNIIEWNRI